MRFSRLAAVSGFCFCFALTIAAQQQTSPQTQEAIDKAHADMLKSGGDKAAEAGRATEALSRIAAPRRSLGWRRFRGRTTSTSTSSAGWSATGFRTPRSPCDEEFVRRAYLDATGLLPEPQEVRDFLASKDPNKRDALIDALVGSERVRRAVGVAVGGSPADPQRRVHLLVQAGTQARSAIQRDGQGDPERRRDEDAEQQPGVGGHGRTAARLRARARRHRPRQLLTCSIASTSSTAMSIGIRPHVPRHQHGLRLVPRRRAASRAAQPVPDHEEAQPSSTPQAAFWATPQPGAVEHDDGQCGAERSRIPATSPRRMRRITPARSRASRVTARPTSPPSS